MSNYKNLSTKLVHTGRQKRYTQSAVNSVIQRASSLVFETLEEKNTPPKIAIKVLYFMDDVAHLPIFHYKKRCVN